MKSQNMHLLLGVLLFASLCGAPKKTHVTRFRGAHLKENTEGMEISGVMSLKKKSASLGRESLKKDAKELKRHKEKKAATKIQAVVRGNKVRKKLGVKPRSGSDASSVSARSRSRSVSPKGRKGAATSAPVADPTETTDGILG